MTNTRHRLLSQLLLNAPFEGWNDSSFRHAARKAGVSHEEATALFPSGIDDLLVFYSEEADRQMVEQLRSVHFDSMKIRDRIHLAVMTRLEQALDEREAVRRALAALALPVHARLSLRLLSKTVDAMWRAIGDQSTDFSFYTKRAILAAVYTSTLSIWLDDTSPGMGETRQFLSRRIENVMLFGKWKARIAQWGSSLMPAKGHAQ